MQLSNMEYQELCATYLDERLSEVLLAHGMLGSEIPLFLKYIDIQAMQCPNQFRALVASFFEISPLWLAGLSKQVTETIKTVDSLQNCLQYLVQGKRLGWKPKFVFVQSAQPADNACLVLIELFKVTKTGMGYITYKQWEPSIAHTLYNLCKRNSLYYRGIKIGSPLYQALREHLLLPIIAIKAAQHVWQLEKSFPVVDVKIPKKAAQLLAELRCTAITPTHLLV